MIIGLSGYARSGKDTIVNILVESHGFIRVSFADAIKESLFRLNPLVPIDPDDWQTGHISLQDFIERKQLPVEWQSVDKVKDHPEVRELLQRMGTEVGRDLFGPDHWVNIALGKMQDWKQAHYAVPDVRFPNEWSAIRSVPRGEVWRVSRPHRLAINEHASEVALDDHTFDRWLLNNDTIERLAESVDKAVRVAFISFAAGSRV